MAIDYRDLELNFANKAMANRKLQKTVKVAGILFAWWIFSVTAGIYNKAYLDIYSVPIFLTVRRL